MKVLNRNQQLAVDYPMRGVRAVMFCLLAVLALSGCMHTTSPVATAQPQSDLDYMAYGRPAYYPAPAPPSHSGGAIAALRASFAASPRTYAPAQYAPAQAAYAATPVAYDTAYR